MAEEKKCPILVWDASAIIRADAEERMREAPLEDEADENDAWEAAAEGIDLEFELECLTDLLTDEMERRNPGGIWYVEATNFGWRHMSGHKIIRANNGKDFLRQILPNTDCTFWIYPLGEDGLKINNCHHDSPIRGVEWYHAWPAVECDHCGDLVGEAAGTTANGTFCEHCIDDELEYAEAIHADEAEGVTEITPVFLTSACPAKFTLGHSIYEEEGNEKADVV